MYEYRNRVENGVLGDLKNDQDTITMFLKNGYQMTGFVEDYDDRVVILQSETKRQMVYRSVISTITFM